MAYWYYAFGNRFTGKERAVFRKSIDAMERKLADKYGGGKIGTFQYRFRLDIDEVREELANASYEIS